MFKLVVIGFSAGGIPVVKTIIKRLRSDYPLPIVIVAHIPKEEKSELHRIIGAGAGLKVIQAVDKATLKPGFVYVAPPGYHTLIEDESHIALSVDAPVCNVCPSIDVLFESAAEATDGKLIGVALGGANTDGAKGMALIKQLGGLTVVQNPGECQFKTLPQAAIDATEIDYAINMEEIVAVLNAVGE